MYSTIKEHIRTLNNPQRPNAKQYIEYIFDDFVELSGDRLYGDDKTILGGIGLLNNKPITIIGQLRGKTLCEQILFNFSMPYPEGFRKALRLMKQAEKFRRPIVCFVDTIGAYPGKQAEERGQAAAIANCIMEMMDIDVPIITIVIGNGGSGGALALCVSDRLAILNNAVLSVISPKACAEILWKDMKREPEAVALLKMTAHELYDQKIVDEVISEALGGVHTDSYLQQMK